MALFNITDDLSELVYVVDMDTYELLYINKTGMEIFHLNRSSGGICYKALQGKDKPCEFCTNPILTEDSLYSWQYFNPVVRRHYQLKDKIIRWNGKKVRLEIAFDTTELENQKMALQESLRMENVVTYCAKKLTDLENVGKSLGDVIKVLGDFLKSDRVYIFEIRGERMDNTYEWCAPGVRSEQDFCQNMPLSLIGRWRPAFDKNECVVIEDIEKIRGESPQEYQVLSSQGIRSLIAGPLIVENKLVGYIGVDNYAAPMQQGTITLFTSVSYFISAILRHRQLVDFDMLTGLRNRNRYMRDLRGLLYFPMGVVYVDVNGLKEANDTYGHKQGDEILVHAAGVLTGIFEKAHCYRVGGDEFVVMEEKVQEADFLSRARKLEYRMSVEEDFSASVGYSWSDGVVSVEELVLQADEQMYSNKKGFYRGRALTRRYRDRFDDILGLSKPGVLEQKLEAGCFTAYYQPKIRVSTGKLSGAEALVRYFDEAGCCRSPIQFIPYLEEAGSIGALDYYMFEQVCRQLREWRAVKVDVVPMSVNFSRYTLQQPHFAERIQQIRENYRIPEELLEIEVTETIEARDREVFYQALSQLQEKNFRIAIDDFGVSNANLALLTDFDFDVLKIDKHVTDGLVKSERSRVLLEAVVEICTRMGIHVVVEGVETQEQMKMLQTLSCQEAQGYLFGKPMPAAEFLNQYLKKFTGN